MRKTDHARWCHLMFWWYCFMRRRQYSPWEIGQSRGTGIVVDSSRSVLVRRYAVR